jgi:hypothetical protein
VPPEARTLTKPKCDTKTFIESSQSLANYLFEQHTGAISPGPLCVIDATAKGLPAVILMKLERERGAELQLSGEPGHRTFEMSVLNDLVLTDGSQLWP